MMENPKIEFIPYSAKSVQEVKMFMNFRQMNIKGDIVSPPMDLEDAYRIADHIIQRSNLTAHTKVVHRFKAVMKEDRSSFDVWKIHVVTDKKTLMATFKKI